MADLTIQASKGEKENQVKMELKISSPKYAKEIRDQLKEQGFDTKLVKITEIE